MEILSFILVIISSFTHAFWNFLTKRAIEKDIFVGLSKIVEVLLFFIPYLLILKVAGFDLTYWYFVIIAACFVFLNYFFLSRSYQRIDLSIAYPVSRSSTLFLPGVAFVLLGETVDRIGWTSIILILFGVFLMYADDLLKQRRQLVKNAGVLFALFAAFTVACYTVWDKMAVHHLHPFVYFYSYTLLTSIFYGGVLSLRFSIPQIKREWEQKKRSIVAVAVLNTFTYLLVLLALSLSKAIYVGALRQVSLVVGVFLSWKILHEEVSIPRILGVLCIIAGSLFILVAN